MSHAAIRNQFETHRQTLPGADALRAARSDALERFDREGFPNRRLETWHYTDLGKLADKALSYVVDTPDTALLDRVKVHLAALDLAALSERVVFVDGHLIASLSTFEQAGIDIVDLADTPDVLLDEPEIAGSSGLTALNTAFAATGAVVRISAVAAQPIHLIFVGSGRALAPQPRLKIDVAESASATIVEHFVDIDGADEAWLNVVTDMALAPKSHLRWLRLQAHGPNQYQTSLLRATLATGASLEAGNIEFGGKLVRHEIELALTGEAAKADLYGLAVGRDRQHIDNRWAVDHRAAHTVSRQDYRAIVADRSRSIFNGKVTVRKHAQHIDANQRNDNLLLSPQAEADTKPELEIYADQVICSHGATVGEISEEQMFYLRARGIDEATARGILTAAFAEKILHRITLEDVRARATALLEPRLPRLAELEDEAR